MPATILLCPTSFENRRIEPRLRPLFTAIHTIGVGEHCTHALRTLAGQFGPGTTAILAGVAGGLTNQARAGHAYAISQVTTQDGRTIPARWIPNGAETLPLFSSPVVLSDAQVKLVAARKFHSDLVDMESHHFVDTAQQAGWRWLIVRGVSDDHESQLPEAVMNFMEPSGHTRSHAVAFHLATRPWHIPLMMRLGRASTAAMGAASAVIEKALREQMP
ncbi:MAG: hypothetical protein K8R92_10605 [Planctomycetes bacterium]|nr:hypothetical protein [Planctomycetota bacterium]